MLVGYALNHNERILGATNARVVGLDMRINRKQQRNSGIYRYFKQSLSLQANSGLSANPALLAIRNPLYRVDNDLRGFIFDQVS